MNMKIFLMASTISVGFAGATHAIGFQVWGDVFDAADVDKSGSLTKEECDHHPDAGKFPGFGPWFRNHFRDMDANGDGELTKTEMIEGMEAVQVTGDGVLKLWREGIGFQPK